MGLMQRQSDASWKGWVRPAVALFMLLLAALTPVLTSARDNSGEAAAPLDLATPVTPHFTLALKPGTIPMQAGQSSSTQVITKARGGYSHQLTLSISNVPAGISANLDQQIIPVPGTGSVQLTVNVQSNVPAKSYPITVTATDGTTTLSVKLHVKVGGSTGTGPGAHFQGCWYQTGGHRYQGVRVSVDNAGTYPFDAYLYRGATCDPNEQADRIGFGTPIGFGGFDFIFWFTDFGDQANMSAIWIVGSDKSQCVNYAVASGC